jgi:hypothetical protein
MWICDSTQQLMIIRERTVFFTSRRTLGLMFEI